MKRELHRSILWLAAIAILGVAAHSTYAQEDNVPKQRLRSPAVVRGAIGGEAHASYVIRARKGQLLTVRISWRREGDNSASFSVTKSASFFGGESIKFGKESDDGKKFVGRVPSTGNYYIYVTAHPLAHYTLRVTVR